MPGAEASWGLIGIEHLGARLVERICRSGAPVTLFLSPRSARMTRAACNRCPESGCDMGAMAAEIARPGTIAGIDSDLLRERGTLEAWSNAWQERER